MTGRDMGRDGIEPSTNGLKVHCSTAELTAPASIKYTIAHRAIVTPPLPPAGEGKG